MKADSFNKLKKECYPFGGWKIENCGELIKKV
jgi:hypothetical protein